MVYGVSELHVVKARYSKEGPPTEGRSSGYPGQSKCQSCPCFEATQSPPKNAQPRMLNATSVGTRDISRVATSPIRKKRTGEN